MPLFPLKILDRRALNLAPSKPRTFEIRLQDLTSSLAYRPGDSLELKLHNPAALVDPLLETILEQITLVPQQNLQELAQIKTKLLKSLREEKELSKLPTTSLRKLCSYFSIEEEQYLHHIETSNERSTPRQLLAFAAKWGRWTHWSLEPFLALLPKKASRLYSLASAPSTDQEILILMVRHQQGPGWVGACSHTLCYELPQESQIEGAIHPSRQFYDDDLSRDAIMIGAGTGLAPYRSMLLERKEARSRAKQWLIFGEREQACDFYYQELWRQLSSHIDLKVSTAFSRDQKEKFYVQDLLWLEKKSLWAAIKKGALLFLCGDAKAMAKGVEEVLKRVAKELGGESDPEKWLRQLVRSRQLRKDVY